MSSISFLPVKHEISRVLHAYADWRVGATEQEKRCYKPSDSVLLTFDDFGSAEELAGVLAILREKRVRAMFFLVGAWAGDHPELVGQIEAEGHIVGNHTATHRILLRLPFREFKREAMDGGLPGPWLRPPRGRYNKRVREFAARLGLAICYWSIDSRDWTGVSAAEMQHTIFSELHPGAVILFHIFGRNTRRALPAIIDGIRARGYQLTDWSEPDWLPESMTHTN